MKFVYLCGSIQPADQEAALHVAQMAEGDELEVTARPRTTKQNSSLWQYCTLLANALNCAGFDMRTFPFREGLEIPFTKDSVMSCFWRPIQDAMFDKTSTRALSTVEIQQVYQSVDKAISERTNGVRVEWPSRESQDYEAQKVA